MQSLLDHFVFGRIAIKAASEYTFGVVSKYRLCLVHNEIKENLLT